MSDRNFRLVAAFILACGAIAPGAALCSRQDEIVRRDWKIGGFKPPPRWDMLPPDQATYPQLLAWASRGAGADRAVMSLIAKRLIPGTSAQSFADQSAAVPGYGGVRVTRVQTQAIEGWGGHRVVLDGVIEGAHRKVVRQIFLINGSIGYILTLVAPQSQALPRLRDMEDTAADLQPLPSGDGDRPR